jgi:hypothetical protein
MIYASYFLTKYYLDERRQEDHKQDLRITRWIMLPKMMLKTISGA